MSCVLTPIGNNIVQVGVYDSGDSYTHIRAGNLLQPGISCDTAADLPAQAGGLSGYYLEQGSCAHVINENALYIIQSDGTWVKQDTSPFSNVYTKSEIDTMLAAMQYEIDSFYAVKYAVEDIINYSIVKNIFETTATTQTITDVTFTNNNDGTWTTSGTAAARRQKVLQFTVPNNLSSGDYVLSGCPSGGEVGGTVKYCLFAWDLTDNVRLSSNDTGDGMMFSWTPNPAHSYCITIDIRSGTNADGLVFKPMITLKSYYDLTPVFRPHP